MSPKRSPYTPEPPIPDRKAWGSLEDLDVKYALDLYGGKTVAGAMPHFIRSPIERADELRRAPWGVFAYYVFCFAGFLTSDESAGESDCASCFLSLVREKARDAPQRLRTLYPRLKPAVDTVAGRQSFYDADVPIYGLFSGTVREIEAALDLA